mgnify:CR=1 FL=1
MGPGAASRGAERLHDAPLHQREADEHGEHDADDAHEADPEPAPKQPVEKSAPKADTKVLASPAVRKRAKDLGSAAQMLALLLITSVWSLILFSPA